MRVWYALGAIAALAACAPALPPLTPVRALVDSATGDIGASPRPLYGNWVMNSDPDSTVFAGASHVELQLTPGHFRLVALYPGQQPLALEGPADVQPAGGVITLMPEAYLRGGTRLPERPAFVPPGAIRLVASAVGDMMVVGPSPTARGVGLGDRVWWQRGGAVLPP